VGGVVDILLLKIVLYGSVQSVQQGEGAQQSRHLLAHFLRLFLEFPCCKRVVHYYLYNNLLARISRCYFSGGLYNSTNLAHFPRQKLWDILGVVSGFLLLENVFLLLICTF
jgi:hypothetical protein